MVLASHSRDNIDLLLSCRTIFHLAYVEKIIKVALSFDYNVSMLIVEGVYQEDKSSHPVSPIHGQLWNASQNHSSKTSANCSIICASTGCITKLFKSEFTDTFGGLRAWDCSSLRHFQHFITTSSVISQLIPDILNTVARFFIDWMVIRVETLCVQQTVIYRVEAQNIRLLF